MYTVTLEQDYFKAVFEFGTGKEALRFMNIARNHYLPMTMMGSSVKWKSQ